MWIFTTVRTNPNPNPTPNSNLSLTHSRGDSKENVYLHGTVNYWHAVNCSKLIKVRFMENSVIRRSQSR